ncbi:hypothetical protein ACODTT_06690 [Acinetobacter pittii]|uniref:hypothetical protein n=1 Tax=Acinetobacter pittii TaxID=48296 RepID=UPI00094C8CA4|nr:hypothetical protein [Acinetobacter pittii]
MSGLIKRLYAIGTSGKAKGDFFEAKKNKNGFYVLNLKVTCGGVESTNKAVNKVEVETLDKAYELLKSDNYLINLTDKCGNRALREYSKVKIDYF